MGILDVLRRLLRRPASRAEPDDGFEVLNHRAPLRSALAHSEVGPDALPDGALLCREAVLGRDHRVAGYRFLLRESTRNRIRRSTRVIHHVYAEVLIGSLVQSAIPGLLGHRQAFIEVPDSFLAHRSLQRLPAATAILIAIALDDENGRPDAGWIAERMAELRAAGYRVGVHAEGPRAVPEALQARAHFVVFSGQDVDPVTHGCLADSLKRLPGRAAMFATDVSSLDDFQYFHALGADCFHGRFVTAREDWRQAELGPELLQVRSLLDALQRDAADAEIVALTKRNPGMALRMLQHANAATSGVQRDIESIEQALQLVGRDRLLRWVVMAVFGRHPPHGRSPAALEAALVRARLLEGVGPHAGGDSETLFLLGLLSLVDVVLRLDLAHALDALAVSDDIRRTLLERRGRLLPPLLLAEALEAGDADEIAVLASNCNLTLERVSALHAQALAWALEVRDGMG